jgi:hypothetical protein
MLCEVSGIGAATATAVTRLDMRWNKPIRRALSRTALLVRLLACAAFLLLSGIATFCAAQQENPVRASAVGRRFAIADFDGDLKPDLATVLVGGSDTRTTQYSIRFELSGGAGRSISFSAPSGGLQIVPQDVNGDEIPDLVVSTQWLNRPVAVLLNDGHGNFTLADPGAFPNAMRNSQTEWSAAGAQIHDGAAIPPPYSSAKACALRAAEYLAGGDSEQAPSYSLPFYVVQRDFGSAGRAPPFAILHV